MGLIDPFPFDNDSYLFHKISFSCEQESLTFHKILLRLYQYIQVAANAHFKAENRKPIESNQRQNNEFCDS